MQNTSRFRKPSTTLKTPKSPSSTFVRPWAKSYSDRNSGDASRACVKNSIAWQRRWGEWFQAEWHTWHHKHIWETIISPNKTMSQQTWFFLYTSVSNILLVYLWVYQGPVWTVFCFTCCTWNRVELSEKRHLVPMLQVIVSQPCSARAASRETWRFLKLQSKPCWMGKTAYHQWNHVLLRYHCMQINVYS